MRIRNKEIRRRRHRKEQVIKAAIKEAKASGSKPRAKAGSAAETKPAPKKRTTTKSTEPKAAKSTTTKKKTSAKAEETAPADAVENAESGD